MRPSSLLALHLLLATFVIAIANAEEYTTAAPAPSPQGASLSSPPPPPAFKSPPPPPPPVNPPAWSPLRDVNDRTVQQVGQFAVHAYCLNTRARLVFVNVISGQIQPYNGGKRYQLVITVAGPGAETAQYSVSVWGILGTTTWQLWSFGPKLLKG